MVKIKTLNTNQKPIFDTLECLPRYVNGKTFISFKIQKKLLIILECQILLMTLLVAAPAFGAFTPLGMAPGKPPSPPIQKETVQLWHEQILDHFKPLDNRKWNQV